MTQRWVALAGSQIGSVHVRDGTPAQDAHRVWSNDTTAVIAVADGHGHKAHFRSGIGSELATAFVTDLLVAAVANFHDAQEVQEQLTSVIGPALVEAWTAGVLDHVERHPFTEVDEALLAGDTTLDLLRPYGSTIVAMAASDDVLGVLQIGDGDAVVALENGDIIRPLPVDLDLDGARTTSLCQPDPLRSLRCAGLDVAAGDIALGFVCTDGFGSARVDAEGWWKQVGEELLEHSRAHGFDWIASKLPLWLDEPAQYGGDDTTLALLVSARASVKAES